MPPELDIQSNRSSVKYRKKELVLRVFWMLGSLVFRCSPRPAFQFRRVILRMFGANIGKDVHIYPSASIYYPWNLVIGNESAIGEHALIYNLGKVRIGNRVTISQRAHLCGGSHDHSNPTMPLLRTPINVDDDAWVCADAFIGPGVHLKRGAIAGARAVVTKDVSCWKIVAGNPAREVGDRKLRAIENPQTK
ncbi:LbetaH domain-containing protein [Rhodopirellula baltica]